MSTVRTPGRIAIATLAAALGTASLSVPGLAAAASPRPAAPAPTTLRAWGLNKDFALGAGGNEAHSLVPVKVKLPKGVTVTSVRSGCDFAVALTRTGVLDWGGNSFGQLGDGTRKTRKTPVQVHLPKGVTVTAVQAGCDHVVALTKTGTVLSWGADASDRLGDGGRKNSGVPVAARLAKGTRVTAIAAGCGHSLAVTARGKVYAWGVNTSGQLGDGTMKPRRNPVLVHLPAGTVATSVSAGCSFSFALTSRGLFGWGSNAGGQLGDPDLNPHPTPGLINFLFRGTGPGTIRQLFGGCNFTVALFSKGAVLAWGDDTVGELGDGGTMGSTLPVAVTLPAGLHVHSIGATCVNGYAQTTDGSVYAWGAGDSGELGNGGTSLSSTPVKVKLPVTLNPIGVGSGAGSFSAFAITVKATA